MHGPESNVEWCAIVTYFLELSLISLHWFLTTFASVVHMRVLLRIWDLFFYEGSVVLFRMTLAMIQMKVKEIVDVDNSASIFNALSDAPGDVQDVDLLIEVRYKTSTICTHVLVNTPENLANRSVGTMFYRAIVTSISDIVVLSINSCCCDLTLQLKRWNSFRLHTKLPGLSLTSSSTRTDASTWRTWWLTRARLSIPSRNETFPNRFEYNIPLTKYCRSGRFLIYLLRFSNWTSVSCVDRGRCFRRCGGATPCWTKQTRKRRTFDRLSCWSTFAKPSSKSHATSKHSTPKTPDTWVHSPPSPPLISHLRLQVLKWYIACMWWCAKILS